LQHRALQGRMPMPRALRRALVMSALAAVAASGGALVADDRVPYTITVENASAKIGEPTAVKAVLTAPDGFQFTTVYRHRVIDLSAFDDGVAFERKVVLGQVKDGALTFEVPVTPTKAGEHPINGLIRVSFNYGSTIESKSVPLMATVTGTE
jgi:hypothetical protein